MLNNKQVTTEELSKYRLIPLELLDNLINQIYTNNKPVFDLYGELMKVKQQQLTSTEKVIEQDKVESNDKLNS